MSKKRRRYSAEFKEGAILMVVEGGQKASEVARDLGLSPTLLARWVREFEERGGKSGLLVDERAELEALRRENQRLRMERDFLKKASAYFAGQQKPDSTS